MFVKNRAGLPLNIVLMKESRQENKSKENSNYSNYINSNTTSITKYFYNIIPSQTVKPHPHFITKSISHISFHIAYLTFYK